jgi:hypothetical protein
MVTVYKPEEMPYTLGRGKVSVARDADWADSGDHALGRLWQDLWHVKEFKVMMSADQLEHENFSGGVKRVDRTAVLKQGAKFSFVVDVPCVDNVLMMLLGDEVTDVTQSSATLSAVSMTVQALGVWHEILNATDDNVYNLTSVSVTDDAGTPVALTLDEDYALDAVHGRIMFYGDGPLTIVATDIVKITATIPADTIKRIEGGSNPNLKRHIWFCGDPAEGIIQQVRGWGLLVPSGDFSLIGDEWQGFTVEGSFIAHSVYGDLGFRYEEVGSVVSGS